MEEQRAAEQRRRGTDWGLQAVLLAMSTVLILQNTKQAMLPRGQTNALWIAEGVGIACVLILRSGWARDYDAAADQARLGTLVNDFYEPRRDAIMNGLTVALGVFGALCWALATWGVFFQGMRRGVAARGMADFATGAMMGACTGGLLGAVLGLAIGHIWETRHRRKRLERRLSNA